MLKFWECFRSRISNKAKVPCFANSKMLIEFHCENLPFHVLGKCMNIVAKVCAIVTGQVIIKCNHLPPCSIAHKFS